MKKNLPLMIAPLALAALVFSSCASGIHSRPNIHGMISRVGYGDNVAYILGSMHQGRANWFPLGPTVEEAMARADVFVFETDLELAESPEVVEYAQKLLVLPEGTELKDVLSDRGYAWLTRNLRKFNLSYDNVSVLTPVGLSFVLAAMGNEAAGLKSKYSVDDYVRQFARANGKPAIGLNDVFSELDLVFNVPMELQAETFDDFGSSRSKRNDMSLERAYAMQNIAAIVTMLDRSMAEASESALARHMHYAVFNIRDRIFAEEIARLLRETAEPTTFFVTMGIGHLVGGNHGRVFELLGEMGFEVEPLWE